MFQVSYNSERRIKKIRSFLGSDENAPIAILLAAVQFEWIISRAILALGKSPTLELRKRVNRTTGLDAYKDLWRDEVSNPRRVGRLPEIITGWQTFTKSFEARHRLVHGTISASKGYALKHTHPLIQASEAVRQFALELGVDLHVRLKTRRRPKAA
jgi:hypothetical protein